MRLVLARLWSAFGDRAVGLLAVAAVVAGLLVLPGSALALTPPTNPSAVGGNTTVALGWTNPVSADFASERIYRRTSPIAVWTLVDTEPKPSVAWTDSGLTNMTDYSYAIRSFDGAATELPIIAPGGLDTNYWQATDFTTSYMGRAIEGPVNWNTSTSPRPLLSSQANFSVRWTGWVYTDYSELYTWYLNHDDTGRLWIDGTQLINVGCCAENSATANMTVGWHTIQVELVGAGAPNYATLSWNSPSLAGKVVVPADHLGHEQELTGTPTDATVTVTAPNGGENITATTANITWSRTGTDPISSYRLYYSTDGGATYPNFIAGVSGALTSYVWTLPNNIYSTQFRVKAIAYSATSMPLANDASDGNFTVSSSPPAAVTGFRTSAGNGQVLLNWTNPTDPRFDHVQILRSTVEGDPGVPVYTAPDNVTSSWTDLTAVNGTTYYYTARSADATTTYVTSQGMGLSQSQYAGSNFNVFEANEPSSFSGLSLNWGNGWWSGAISGQTPNWFAYDSFSMRWSGQLWVDTDGTYTFDMTANDGSRLWVDNSQVYTSWPTSDCACAASGSILLTRGWHAIRQEYQETWGNAYINSYYQGPNVPRQIIPASATIYEPVARATPMTSTVTVSAPNGGEAWKGETAQTISWTSTAVAGTVSLRYSIDGGQSYPFAITRSQPLIGSFRWSVPPGINSALVRVQAEVNDAASRQPTATDASNANFTVDSTAAGLPPAPSGLKTTAGNNQVQVTWNNPSPISSFDHAVIYRSTAEGDPGIVVYTAPDSTTTSWLDATAINTLTYYYRVRGVDAAGRQSRNVIANQTRYSAYAGNNFNSFLWTDTWASQINPNWGNAWWSGITNQQYPGVLYYDSFSIRWNGLLYADSAGLYQMETDANDGGRVFVDGTLTNSNWPNGDCACPSAGGVYLTQGWHDLVVEYQESWGGANTSLNYSGPGIGRVVVPLNKLAYEPISSATPTVDTVTVTSPNGGQVWKGETTQTLSWTSTAASGSVVLRYSTDGGASFPYTIAAAQPLTGSFRWSVPPNITSAQFRLKAELRANATNQPTVSDMSDANIDVDTNPASLPPAPFGIKAKSGNSQVVVTWNNPLTIGTFDHVVVYRSTAEGDPGAVVYTAPDSATVSWTDLSTVNGTTYYYRVRGVDAAGRQSRNVIANQTRSSVYSGNNFNTYMWTDAWTSQINPNWGNGWYVGVQSQLYPGPIMSDSFSIRWNGLIYADTSGLYQMETDANDGGRVWVDGTLTNSNWPNSDCACPSAGGVYLTQGWHDLVVEYQESWGGASIVLNYSGPGIGRMQVPLTKLAYEPIASATPVADTITVTTPNGGESYKGESVATITWTSTAATGSVVLRYSTDSGVTFPYGLAVGQQLNGSFSWSLPQGLNTTQLRVRAELRSAGINLPTAYDDSDGDVTVDTTPGPLPPGPTDLTALAGANQVTVSWANPSPIGTFDHAAVYRSTNERDPGLVVYTAPNSGVTSWNDLTAINGTTYYYRVRSVDAAGRQGREIIPGQVRYSMYSGNNFNTFLWNDKWTSQINPNWGNCWCGGPQSPLHPGPLSSDSFSIRWNGLIYADTAGLYQMETDANDGGRAWVDGTQTNSNWPNSDCACPSAGSIYLTTGWHDLVVEYQESWGGASISLNYSGPGISRIVVPLNKLGSEPMVNATPTGDTITVTSPDGGENWKGDTTERITWTNTAASGTVELRYSIDGGATYPITIALGQSLNGSYSWSVPPSLITAQARVRAILRSSVTNQPTVYDDSNANFTLDTNPASAPPGPTGVKTLPGNGQVVVSWTSPSPLGTYDHAVVYRSINERDPGTRVYSAPNAATSAFTDNTVTNGVTYYYRVRGADATGRQGRNVIPQKLRVSYFSGNNFNTYLSSDEWAGMLNPNWGNCPSCGPIPVQSMSRLMSDSFSMRWTGLIYADTTGEYQIETDANDGGRAWVDGFQTNTNWPNSDCACPSAGSQWLTQGWHDLVVEYQESWGGANVYLNYAGPGIGRVQVPLTKLGYEEVSIVEPHVAAVTLTAPTGGESLTGENSSITWTTSGAPLGSRVRLRYSTDSGADFTRLVAGDAGASPYSWYLPRGLTSSTVKVRAELIDTNGYIIATSTSGNLTVDTTTLLPASGLVLTPGWNKIQLDWTNPVGASFDHVNVYRSTIATSLGVKIATLAKPTATYLDPGLVNGTTYYYRVRAANVADIEAPAIESGRILGEYWTGANFDGALKGTQYDTTAINYNWGAGNPAIVGQADNWSVRWTGYINLDQTNNWTFDNYDSADGSRVWIGGTKLIDEWYGCDCASYFFSTINLNNGWVPFTYEMHETTGVARTYLYYSRPGLARQIVPIASLGMEMQRAAAPADITPPVPNPNGQGAAVSPTQINWQLPGASDGIGSGLHATPYSFDNAVSWQAADTFPDTGLTANTLYTRSLVVRDAALNQTTPKAVSVRTLAVAPNVVADRSPGVWLGPTTNTITFSNNVAWGPGGVQYYRYTWDNAPNHTWSGGETQWSSGIMVKSPASTNDWYLHLQSFNGDDVSSGTIDMGPYRVDLSPPTPNPATVGTAATMTSIDFTVAGATDGNSGLDATAYSFDNGVSWQAGPVYSVGSLSSNQTVSRSVLVRDAVGNVTTVQTATATTLPANPVVTAAPVPDATWRVSGSVITLGSTLAFGPGTIWGYRYRISTAPTDTVLATDPAWTSGTLPVSLVGTSATWYIHARSFNADNVGGSTQDIGPYKIDATGPTATNPIAAADPTNVAPQFSWTSVTDAESGLAGYRIYRSTSAGVLGSLINTQVGTTYTDGDALIDGQRYWYTVQPYDNLGNQQTVGNTQIGITYDSVAPIGNSVVIAAGAAYTGTTAVTLTLASTNASQMIIGNLPDLSDGTWEPMSAARGWVLAAGGDGTKTVYARFKSLNNTLSAVVSDTIVFDTSAPTPNPPTATATIVSSTAITWNATSASDVGSGLPASPYSFDNGTTWQAGVSLAQNALAPNTSYTTQVKYRDALSNTTGSGSVSGVTLPAAPGISSVPAADGVNTQPLGTTFVFANTAGWGVGSVQYYRWVWDTSPAAYSFTGTEPMWNASTLSHQEWTTGTYYLHVLAFNSADAPGMQLTGGPYMLAPPTGSQTVFTNVASTQTLSCAKTDFSVALLPGISDDATVDCTASSAVAGWNLAVHVAAVPFFTGFTDAAATVAAYAAPTGANAVVSFTSSGAYSYPSYANGTQWRGYSGLTDIVLGGDTGTNGGTVITNRIRAALGPSAALAPGARSQTLTYTLSPGAPP